MQSFFGAPRRQEISRPKSLSHASRRKRSAKTFLVASRRENVKKGIDSNSFGASRRNRKEKRLRNVFFRRAENVKEIGRKLL